MKSSWEVARITSINNRTGQIEVYCAKFGRFISAKLKDLINSRFTLHDRVRIFVEILPYTVRLKMVTKTRSMGVI